MSLKQNLYNLLTIRVVNKCIKFAMKPVAHHLPVNLLERIPVVGPINVSPNFNNHQSLYLETDGGDVVAGMIYWLGLEGFEGATMKIFTHLLRHARTVIDIGANTGIYALLAGLENSGRAVYAFEPMPKVFKELKKNVYRNQLANVFPFQYAVSNFEGETQFHTYPSVRLPYISSIKKTHSDSITINVEVVTLDSFVKRYRLSNIDLLKIDTESTEPLVMEGAKETIARDLPLIICEVLSEAGTESELQKRLAYYEYEYFLITPEGLIRREKIIGDHLNGNFNYLFVPCNKRFLLEGADLAIIS
jgi:FkbM family methyltransferase